MRKIQYLYYFRILLPFSLGIITGNECALSMAFWWYCFAGCAILGLLLFFIKKRFLSQADPMLGLLMVCSLFISGGLLTANHIHAHKQDHHFAKHLLNEACYIEFKVIERPKQYKNQTLRLYASVKKVYMPNQKKGLKVSGKVLVYCYNTSFLPQIDQTALAGPLKIKPISESGHPGGFNMAQYLKTQGISYQIQINESQTAWHKNFKKSLKFYAIQTQELIQNRLSMLFGPQYLGFAQALLLGDKSELNPKVISSFSNTGTMHVLAVSGLHAGIVFIILNLLFRFLTLMGTTGKIINYLCLVIGLWFYAFITGLPPSVMRAALMLTLVQTALLLKRRSLVFNNIFASAFVFLLYNPMLLYHVGFQLSYSAVVGILAIQPALQRLWDPPNKIAGYFWDISTVSVAAQAATLPVSLYYFHQLPLLFLVANLVIIPAILMLMIALILTSILGSIPTLGTVLIQCSEFLIGSLQSYTQFLDSLPFASVQNIPFNLVEAGLYYVILFGSTQFLFTFKRKYLNLTLLSSLLFLLYHLYLQNKTKNQIQLLVLQTPNYNTVALIEGDNAALITDSTYVKNKSATENLLNGLRYTYRINNRDVYTWHDSAKRQTWVLNKGYIIHSQGIIYGKNEKGIWYYNSDLTSKLFITDKSRVKRIQNSGKSQIEADSIIILNKWKAL